MATKQFGAIWSPAKLMLTPERIRQIKRNFNNLKITLMCGLLTLVVLRGTIGAGKFGTPAEDLNEIRRFFPGLKKEPSRVLKAVKDFKMEDQEEESTEPQSVGSNIPYSLGPKISDWNEQRRKWLLKHPLKSSSSLSDKPKILLATGSQPKACDNPEGNHFLLKSLKNKIDYCRLHDVEIFYSMAHLDQEMAGYWAKLPLIRKLMLSHPEVEWIWWMDSDALFTDMTFELPMDRYKEHNLVLHGWDELVYEKRNWVGLNTGSFLLRNCQWSLDLLDAWAPMGPKGEVRSEAGKLLTKSLSGRPAFEADDQSALVYLLATQRAVWGDGIYLENAYCLHGYWAGIVDKYEEMMEKYHAGFGDDRWPFVTHFVGCKPCDSFGSYPVERCLKQMERAFNFADNQVLEIYGFHHRSLNSSNVKRIRNNTAQSLQPLD